MIPKRVVLDTNVCLDLFVFKDPRWHDLHQALQQEQVQAVTREDCRREWHIVLGYAHLKLDAENRDRVAAQFDTLIQCLPMKTTADEPGIKLPICKDRDDQKFLELAYDSHAYALITKDKALLKLAGKARRLGLFGIMTPDTWTRERQRASMSAPDHIIAAA